MSDLLSKSCPKCGRRTRIWKLRGEFDCAGCGTRVGTNIETVRTVLYVVYFVSLPFAWWFSDLIVRVLASDGGGYLGWRFTVTLLELALLLVLYPLITKIWSAADSSTSR